MHHPLLFKRYLMPIPNLDVLQKKHPSKPEMMHPSPVHLTTQPLLLPISPLRLPLQPRNLPIQIPSTLPLPIPRRKLIRNPLKRLKRAKTLISLKMITGLLTSRNSHDFIVISQTNEVPA